VRRSSAPRPCVRHETTGPNPEQWRAPTVKIDQRANFQMNDEQTTLKKFRQLYKELGKELSKPQYTVKANCYNCGVESTVRVNKGVALDTVECPNCGCKSLIAKL